MRKVLVSLILVLAALGSNAQDSMKVVYFDSFPPYSWLDENRQMRGILIDVLEEAIQNRMQVTLEHQGYPWVRAQMLVKKNKADAFVSVPTPERQLYTATSQHPVLKLNFTMFVRKDHPLLEEIKQVQTIEELSKFKLGHYRGSGWALRNLAKMDVQWAPSLDNALTMLAKNRFDIFVDASRVTQRRIVQLGLTHELVELPNLLQSNTFNLCISKNSHYVHLLRDFDNTIKEMQADGSLQEIYSRYY